VVDFDEMGNPIIPKAPSSEVDTGSTENAPVNINEAENANTNIVESGQVQKSEESDQPSDQPLEQVNSDLEGTQGIKESEEESVVKTPKDSLDNASLPDDRTLIAEEELAEDPEYVARTTAKIIETAFGRGPISKGPVRAVEDIFQFAVWIGDSLEKATGIERLLKNNTGLDNGIFIDDDAYYTGRVSKHMYESTGAIGQLAEEGIRFVGSYAVTKGAGAGASVSSSVRGALAGPKWTGILSRNPGIKGVVDKAKTLLSSPTMKKFGEGGIDGAITDFAITNREDELILDMIRSTKPEIQETFINSLEDNDPPSLLEKKLRATMEGFLIGGVANVAIDDLLTFFSRARSNGIFDAYTSSPSAQAAQRKAELAPVEDALIGKTYQGENFVKVYDSKGKSFYAKESQVSVDNPRVLKNDSDFVLPSDFAPNLNVDNFSGQDVTEYIRAWEKKYVEAGNLAKASEKISLDSKILNDRQVDIIARVKAIATGSDEDILNAIKRGDTYGIYRGLGKGAVTLDGLADVVSNYGYKLADIQANFPNVSAEQIAVYFYKIDNATRFFDEFLADNIDSVRVQDPEVLAKAKQANDMVESLMADFDNLGSVAGQSLAVYRHTKTGIKRNLNQAIHKYRLSGVDLESLLKRTEARVGLSENAIQLLGRSSKGAIISDMMYAVYVSNLLWGTGTHQTNILSGLTMLFQKNLGRVFVGSGSADIASQAGARAFLRKGMQFSTLSDSMSESLRALRTGKIPDHLLAPGERGKADELYKVYGEMARRYADRPILHGLLKASDWVVTRPTHLLTSTDVFMKQFLYNQTISDGIARAMTEEGKSWDEVIKAVDGIGTKNFDNNVKSLNFDSVLETLEREVSEVTFTMKPNELMSWVNRRLEKRFFGFQPFKFVVPFARIDMNIVRYTVQTTPGLSAFSKTNENIFKNGSIAAQERRLAEMAASSTMMLGAAGLYSSGILTGSGPTDQREISALRRSGWKPYALKIPNYGYYDLRRLGAVGNYLSMGAFALEMADMVDDEEDVQAEYVAGTLSMLAETFTPQFVSQTMPRALNIISDKSDEKKLDALLALIADIIPNAVIPGSGVYSRNAVLLGEGSIKEFSFDENRLKTAWLKAFPHIDQDHKPQVDFLGNDRGRSPWESTKDMDLLEEFERLADSGRVTDDSDDWEASLIWTPPRRHIEKKILEESGKVYKFTNEQYYNYQKYIAGIYDNAPFNPGMKPFKDYWREEMKAGYPEASLIYGSRSDEAVTTWLRDVRRRYSAVAKDLILQDFESINGIIEGTIEGAKKRQELLQKGPIKLR